MKQNIIQISNIKFSPRPTIRKPYDITQTYVYEDIKRLNPTISCEELEELSHVGLVLANLHNFYDCKYDIETIKPTDARYRGASTDIEIYKPTDWLMDDADSYQSGSIELSTDIYEFKHQTTLYMYFDEWIQYGYETFLDVNVWQQALHQVIYEYMRQFLTIEIN